MSKLKIFIIIFVLLAITAYWYYQRNIYSKEVLKLEILGPRQTQLLEEVEYAVKYKNNGNFKLEEAKLTFECPKNSLECEVIGREESPEEKKFLRKVFPLPTIYPGEEKTFRIKARLLGKENEIKEAKAWLTFRPKKLKAIYESSTTFVTQIQKVPLNFEFDLPLKVESGRELKFSLNYFSNLNYPLSDIGIKIEYPEGFEFLESKPKALEKTYFDIKLLNPTHGGRIKIKGLLKGEIEDPKIFKAIFGIWKEGEYIALKEVIRGVEIIEPSLYISQMINNNPDYIANLGNLLHYEIYFRNLGKNPLENLTMIVKLKGKLFDLQTIKSELGENTPGDNTIIWDWKKVPELKFLDSGEEGKLEFWVNLKSGEGLKAQNLVVSNEIIFLGQSKKEFLTKVNSKLLLSQKGYIGDEVFNSPGPLPPRVGEKSYFTIFWEAENFYNSVGNAKVKAIFGPSVELTGKIFPQETIFTFDSVSRELIWQIGDLEPGKKVQFAFQIAFLAQGEESTPLISQAEISAEDKWTNQILSAISPPLSTTLTELPVEESEIE